MSDLNRREFGMAMAAFAAMAGAAEAQAGKVLSEQRVYRYDQLPVHTSGTGVEGRPVLQGKLPTGESLEVHETMLPPGQMPHPPHHHEHSELILIREGVIEYYNNGKTEPLAGPGDVLFNASNVEHGMKNVGTTPAKYFVVAVGVQKTPVVVTA